MPERIVREPATVDNSDRPRIHDRDAVPRRHRTFRFATNANVNAMNITDPLRQRAFDIDTVMRGCNDVLRGCAPQSIIVVEELPRNANGKVVREELVQIAQAHRGAV